MPDKLPLNQKTLWHLALILVAVLLLIRLAMIAEKNKPLANQPIASPTTSTTTNKTASTTSTNKTAETLPAMLRKVLQAGRKLKTENRPLTLIIEPQAGVAPILAAIDNAKKSVDLVIYQLSDEQVEQALVAAKNRGLAVRVMLNPGYYGAQKFNHNAYAYFAAQNIPVHWTPAYFALTHQKTLIIDNQTALIMTFNLTPKYYAADRDFGVIDQAAADVAAIEKTFAADWQNNKTEAQATADLVWSPGAEADLVDLIDSAKISLAVYNEEMADKKIVVALKNAAERKVNVQVVMTDAKNWHTNFQTLAAAGAAIRTFSAKALLYIHAKMILIDDKKVFLGSQNFSSNSLQRNRELGIISTDQTIINSLADTFAADFANAATFAQ